MKNYFAKNFSDIKKIILSKNFLEIDELFYKKNIEKLFCQKNIEKLFCDKSFKNLKNNFA